jgi:hypothetical protein
MTIRHPTEILLHVCASVGLVPESALFEDVAFCVHTHHMTIRLFAKKFLKSSK